VTDKGGGRKISELIPFTDKPSIGKIDETINSIIIKIPINFFIIYHLQN